jgi:hypothetical protein
MEEWMSLRVPAEEEVYVAPYGYLSSLHRKFIASDRYFGEQLFRWIEENTANDHLDQLGVEWLLIDFLHSEGWRTVKVDRYLAESGSLAQEIGTQRLYRRHGKP